VSAILASGTVEVPDEEMLHHLGRGADLLARGELDGARTALERAHALEPRNPRVLGLFGQVLYKLGRFGEASEIYGQLVDQNPSEAAPRVNLGLSCLKARRPAEAVRQLEIALDLAPEHRKAMGYLGLAWLEQRNPARARAWFERAGSSQMVARCDALMKNAAGRAAGARAPPPPPKARPKAKPEAPATLPGSSAPPGLATLSRARRVEHPPGTRFAIAGGLFTVSVKSDALVRAEGLLAVQGAVRLVPEMKRFRGHPTQKAFGEGPRRMLRASGEGTLCFRVPSSQLSVIELAGESGYFREEVTFAFEEAVDFENGRVTSRLGPDLNLVHLRGRGQLVLATRGPVAGTAVSRATGVRVPLAALVGWTGALTPKLAPLSEADNGENEPLVVELTGEGQVLFDEGAG